MSTLIEDGIILTIEEVEGLLLIEKTGLCLLLAGNITLFLLIQIKI
jgi:hypothetical protein